MMDSIDIDEILDAKPDFRFGRAMHKVAPFLTDWIVKFGSKEAEYTPNR